MRMNAAGLKILKKFEGWRGTAYRDPVGVRTIGYGHTSAAGHPKVYEGMKISRKQAEAILLDDLEKTSALIMPMIKVRLNDNQYSALLSFAYNVGAGNFRKSSVLRYTNASRFSDVPSRLMLWNKAGGKILRGLTRRRVAEGALFVEATGRNAMVKELDEARQASGRIAQREGRSGLQSSTNRAGIALFLSFITAIFGDIHTTLRIVMNNESFIEELSWANSLSIFLVAVAVTSVWWIIRERRAKSQDDGI